jgi:outer membrane protein
MKGRVAGGATRRRRARFGVVALAAALPGAVVAQTPRDTLTLGLADALRLAEGSNPTYLQRENQLSLNGVQSRATWLGEVLPDLSLDLFNTGYSGQLTRQFVDFVGNPVDNPDASWIYSSSTRQGFDLTWRVQGLSFLNAREAQALENRGRELDVVAARADLRTTVQQEYYATLREQELLAVEEAILAARQVDLESARRLFSLAQNSRVDVLNAEFAIEQQRAQIQQQRRALEQAILSLRTTLGDPQLPPLRLAAEGLPVFDAGGLDEGALVERARRRNPTLAAATGAVDEARVGLEQARQWRWPTLNLSYSWGRFVRGRDADALASVGYDPNEVQSSFSASMSFPVLNNFFQNRAQEAQARVQLENQREALKQERLDVERQVRSQLINLRNQNETLRLARRSLEIAGEALRLAREEYRIGTRTFEQLQDAVEQEADARRQVTEARYGFVEALLALEQAVGAPVRPEPAGTDRPAGRR